MKKRIIMQSNLLQQLLQGQVSWVYLADLLQEH